MAQLKDKIQNALDEGRMLVLGSQVLLGFQYRSAFEPGFEKLPVSSQYLKLIALGLMLFALGLLLAPGAHHRIVEKGEDTERQHSFTTKVMDCALLPFAVALGLDLYVGTQPTLGYTVAVIAGTCGSLLALFFWYGLEFMCRREREPEIKEEQAMSKEEEKKEQSGAKLKDKIKHVLTECRVVLPGAQALLGFQFITTLTESFEKLPQSSKYAHLSSLVLVAVSIVLLMTPAAYHRIVERGEETEHFHRFASRILLASMIPLALGVCGDFFVVARKITESEAAALIAALCVLLFFFLMWFGITIYRRNQERSGQETVEHNSQQLAS